MLVGSDLSDLAIRSIGQLHRLMSLNLGKRQVYAGGNSISDISA